jgi:BASS family bile acid:Na+ symporter
MHPLILDFQRAFAAAFLVAMMFSIGLALGGEAADKPTKRRQRRLILRALALNLILLPLVAVTLTRALGAGDDVGIAFLLLAASPGGRFAPQLARIAKAELGLAVETTLFLAKLVPFTAPVTARLLVHTHHLELHELPFILQLLGLQLVPYLLGRQLRRRRPQMAQRLDRWVTPAMWTCLVVVLVLIFAGHELQKVRAVAGARGWWAVLAFAAAGPLIGWLAGGPAPGARRALAISANARNLAVALLLASLAFWGRMIELATCGVWLVLLLVDVVYAELVARRKSPQRPTVPAAA